MNVLKSLLVTGADGHVSSVLFNEYRSFVSSYVEGNLVVAISVSSSTTGVTTALAHLAIV
jgi:hypothetical protein